MAPYAWSLLMVVLVSAAPRLGPVAGQDTGFYFEHFNAKDPNLQFSGDAFVLPDGELGLTKPTVNSIGHVFYGPEIRLLDTSTNTVASFSTNVTFQIQGQYKECGDGLAFVVLGSKSSIDDSEGGPFLGVYGSDGVPVAKTLAVEFDTCKNDKVGNVVIDDINANHVGLDLETIKSKIQVDAGTVGIFLADGSYITSWIDYIASTSTIEVRINRAPGGKPVNPLLSYKVDLPSLLCGSEYLSVGFSATTGYLCYEYNVICSWGFKSWGLPASHPPIPPPPTPWNSHPISPPTSPPGIPIAAPPSENRGPAIPPTSPHPPPVWPPTLSPGPGGRLPPAPSSNGAPVPSPTVYPGPDGRLPPAPSSNGSPVPPPTISPGPGGRLPPAPSSNGAPVPSPTVYPGPDGHLPPAPSSNGSPVPPPTVSPGPGGRLPPAPSSNGAPVPSPTIYPGPDGRLPPAPSSNGSPVPPPTISPGPGSRLPPAPSSNGAPVPGARGIVPPTSPGVPPSSSFSGSPSPGRGGPFVPSPPDNDHPERWAVPVAVLGAVGIGFFLLCCWRRHKHRPPPPPPPPGSPSSHGSSHHHSPPHSPPHFIPPPLHIPPPHHHSPPHHHHPPRPDILIEEVVVADVVEQC